MSWSNVKADWTDAAVIPAIRYPSAWLDNANAEELEDQVFAVIDNFSIGDSTPGEINDSLNNQNMGNIEQPARYTSEITVFPTSDAFKLMKYVQNGRRYFDLVFMPASNFEGADAITGLSAQGVWGLEKQVHVGCKVRDADQRYAIGTKPTVTFSCTALRSNVKASEDISSLGFGDGHAYGNTSDEDLGIKSLTE